MDDKKPKVGIGVMILKEGRVLLGKRKGSHGEGAYAFPGGHLEYGEGFEACARREVLEECGLEIDNVRFLLVANVTDYMPKHYVHLTLLADWKSGEPVLKEPEKSEGWDWYALGALPGPVFAFARMSFDSYKTGVNYFDVASNAHAA